MHVFDSVAALHEAAAAIVAASANNALRRRGGFHLGLAGGRTPRGLYELLASAPWRDRIDWSRTHAWFGDERCVPPDHPDSNFGMARQALFTRVPLPPAQLHRMRGELPPDEAARRYEAELRASGAPLDLLLLGLGADGHTASLFPGAPELEERRRWVVAANAPAEPRQRVTLTLGPIRRARRIVLLACGKDKAMALSRVLAPSHPSRRAASRDVAAPPPLPAARLRGGAGAVIWLLDREAASRLPKTGTRP